jgi:hypothetical protein
VAELEDNMMATAETKSVWKIGFSLHFSHAKWPRGPISGLLNAILKFPG